MNRKICRKKSLEKVPSSRTNIGLLNICSPSESVIHKVSLTTTHKRPKFRQNATSETNVDSTLRSYPQPLSTTCGQSSDRINIQRTIKSYSTQPTSLPENIHIIYVSEATRTHMTYDNVSIESYRPPAETLAPYNNCTVQI